MKPRRISPDALALAYELRREYRMQYKIIARMINCNHRTLCKKLNFAIHEGLDAVYGPNWAAREVMSSSMPDAVARFIRTGEPVQQVPHEQ